MLFGRQILVKIAMTLVLFGFIAIVVFMCVPPFNGCFDKANAQLFGLYGDFIGGFIGSIFSLAGFFLVYLTFKSQQESLQVEKKNADRDRFETTFFNLLSEQKEILISVKATLYKLNNDFTQKKFKKSGYDFFSYAHIELKRIHRALSAMKYDGKYNFEDSIKEVNDLCILGCLDNEISKTVHRMNNKHVNLLYSIDESIWHRYSEATSSERNKILYNLFFNKYYFVIGHYFRNLYHILKFIEKYETKAITSEKDPKLQIQIKESCKDYAQFIQAQMSADELLLIYYNSFCFPRMKDLLLKYDFLENLYIEDLIDPSQYDASYIKLKHMKTV